jgi:hypothetical protein
MRGIESFWIIRDIMPPSSKAPSPPDEAKIAPIDDDPEPDVTPLPDDNNNSDTPSE